MRNVELEEAETMAMALYSSITNPTRDQQEAYKAFEYALANAKQLQCLFCVADQSAMNQVSETSKRLRLLFLGNQPHVDGDYIAATYVRGIPQ